MAAEMSYRVFQIINAGLAGERHQDSSTPGHGQVDRVICAVEMGSSCAWSESQRVAGLVFSPNVVRFKIVSKRDDLMDVDLVSFHAMYPLRSQSKTTTPLSGF